MKRKQAPLHHALIASPRQLQDALQRAVLDRTIGDKAVWVITASAEAVRHVTTRGLPVNLTFAASKASSGRHNVAVVLQVGTPQFRSVVGLNNPFFIDALADAFSTGEMQVVLGTKDGDLEHGLLCEVDRDDLMELVALTGVQGAAPLEQRVIELTFTAANCRVVEELPSIIAGVRLKTVEASLVVLGETLVDDVRPTEVASKGADEAGTSAVHRFTAGASPMH